MLQPLSNFDIYFIANINHANKFHFITKEIPLMLDIRRIYKQTYIHTEMVKGSSLNSCCCVRVLNPNGDKTVWANSQATNKNRF